METKEIAVRLACAVIQKNEFTPDEESAGQIVNFYKLVLSKLSEGRGPGEAMVLTNIEPPKL